MFSIAFLSSLQVVFMLCDELSSPNGVLKEGAMARVDWQQMEGIRICYNSSPSATEVGAHC